MHVDRAVALSRKAIAKTEEGFFCRADEAGEGLDLRDFQSGDRGGPDWIARSQMRLEAMGIVGVFFEIRPVGEPVAKQNVHDRAGQCAIRPRPQAKGEIGLFHGRVAVDVDDDQLRAALLPGARDMGHHVDLRGDGVGSP